MPITAKELREKRAALVAQARKIQEKAETEKRQMNAEERKNWADIMGDNAPDGTRVIGEIERLKDDIDRLERLEKLEDEMRSPIGGDRRQPGREDGPARESDDPARGPTEEQRALAFQAWTRHQYGLDLTERHQEACRAVGFNYRARELSITLPGDYRNVRRYYRQHGIESRAAGAALPQSALLQNLGAATVPEGFVNNLEVALLQYGGIREAADVMRTTSGQDLPWPTVNDTTVKGSILAENQVVTTKDMNFGVVVFHAYKYTSGLVLVPVELIEDSAFKLADTIGDLCGIRIGRGQADDFTFGNGAAKPNGLLTAATLGVTGAVAGGIAADDLYNLKHSVDPAYRSDASWMMHDQILLVIKKLKDGLGRYLWQASLAGGAPDTIDGDPVTINQSMPSALTGQTQILAYGMMSKYKIRDVSEIRLRRLVERYADQDQEGFVLFMRSDGNLLDAGTHPVKYLQQPT